MSPITDDEQVDELKERRRARESRPGSKRETAVRIPSAEPARDLLGGLITTGAPENGEESSASAQHAAPATRAGGAVGIGAPVKNRQDRPALSAARRSTSSSEGSRRAHRRTPTSRRRSSNVVRKALQTCRLHRRLAVRTDVRRSSPRSRRHAARPRTTRLLGIVATVVVAGTAVLVVALNGGSSRLSPARSAQRGDVDGADPLDRSAAR